MRTYNFLRGPKVSCTYGHKYLVLIVGNRSHLTFLGNRSCNLVSQSPSLPIGRCPLRLQPDGDKSCCTQYVHIRLDKEGGVQVCVCVCVRVYVRVPGVDD
jgi:hypothetical protein